MPGEAARWQSANRPQGVTARTCTCASPCRPNHGPPSRPPSAPHPHSTPPASWGCPSSGASSPPAARGCPPAPPARPAGSTGSSVACSVPVPARAHVHHGAVEEEHGHQCSNKTKHRRAKCVDLQPSGKLPAAYQAWRATRRRCRPSWLCCHRRRRGAAQQGVSSDSDFLACNVASNRRNRCHAPLFPHAGRHAHTHARGGPGGRSGTPGGGRLRLALDHVDHVLVRQPCGRGALAVKSLALSELLAAGSAHDASLTLLGQRGHAFRLTIALQRLPILEHLACGSAEAFRSASWTSCPWLLECARTAVLQHPYPCR